MTEVVSAPIPRAANSSVKLARRLIVAIAVLTLTWSICLVIGVHNWKLQWAANILLPLAVVALVIILTVRREHRLHWPLKTLDALLPKVRSGEEPIESLESISNSLSDRDPENLLLRSIVGEVQESLRDVKRQKFELAKLNEEMRQRIAGRTDALERTIGSLRVASERDALTTLGNRRMLDAMMPKWIESARVNRTPLAAMVIDVDYFKQLNDTLGHAAGDDFLRDLGRLMKSTIRPTDMAFRLGGDEFVIVLPTNDKTAAQRLSERLGSLVDALTDTLRVTNKPRLSIGIAELSELSQIADAGASQLLSLADQRLYAIKQFRKSARI